MSIALAQTMVVVAGVVCVELMRWCGGGTWTYRRVQNATSGTGVDMETGITVWNRATFRTALDTLTC